MTTHNFQAHASSKLLLVHIVLNHRQLQVPKPAFRTFCRQSELYGTESIEPWWEACHCLENTPTSCIRKLRIYALIAGGSSFSTASRLLSPCRPITPKKDDRLVATHITQGMPLVLAGPTPQSQASRQCTQEQRLPHYSKHICHNSF